MRTALIALLGVTLAACQQPAETTNAAPAPPAPVTVDVPAGAYRIDPMHSTIHFRVNHIGMSNYTAAFERFNVELTLDPANPAAAQVNATIDVRSLALPAPPAGFLEDMLGASWFDTARFPEITFRSTAIEMTSANTAHVTGDLTLHGVTKPVTLDATFNGGYAGHPMDPNARIGFSAHGTFNRSEFGMGYGVPPEGSTMGVSDAVEVIIETEFNGPAWAGAAPVEGAAP
ncbi:yceI family protein [alpha proteobacterium U9-1i]|nr:yceI family protein [alpha proteobacterium U9-1i]